MTFKLTFKRFRTSSSLPAVLHRATVCTVLAASCISGAAQATRPAGTSADVLKFIDLPGGGHVVYGSLDDVSTMPQAMGFMLRQVHGHFGDRPQVGRFFQSKSGDSLATFFTLTAKKQDGKPTSGLVIVAMPAGTHPAAAVLFDNSDRFAKTEPTLMAKLTDAWRKQSEQSAQAHAAGHGSEVNRGAQAAAAPVPPMRAQSVGDGTSSISLPAGWTITGSGAGQVHVAGPHGEGIHMGVMIQNIYDPRNPRAASLVRYMQMGHNPVIVCPRTNDMVSDYVCVSKQFRALQHKPPMDFNPTQVTPMQNGGAVVLAKVDEHDGVGAKIVKLQIAAMPEGPQGGWVMTLFSEVAPEQVASQQWPTINAIAASYRQNGRALFAQSEAIVNDIHARSELNTKLAQGRSEQNDEHNRSVEQYWDDNAKYNKSFENYQLDRSTIATTDNEYHGTFDNRTADALVQSNPDRFQYVQTRDLLKGIDY